jgi:hypothetical protein
MKIFENLKFFEFKKNYFYEIFEKKVFYLNI